jgi:CubicO group peptidase (beta-lactamase class C family)
MPAGRVSAAALGLVGALCSGCTGDPDGPSSEAGPEAPVERAYWPTDDWRTDAPEDHGFDADELAEIDRLVADSYSNVRSIAIVRDGHLVHEDYWQGFDAADGHDVRSVTKSVVGALVGIAIEEGLIEGLDATVGELFADRLPADADPRMAGVTVRQLLSMTAGLPGDDPSLGGDERVFEQVEQSPDWVRAVLGLPLTTDPGSRFEYSSATSHLLSALVADATGGSILDFARERLFGPLGIATDDAFEPAIVGPPTPQQVAQYDRATVAWPTDPQGYHFGFAFLKLPTRDLARFGFLYLNDGRWEDEQIVPADYVRASTSSSVSTPDGSADYGWQWWVPRQNDDGSFFARGYGGQVIYVDPALDLVTVVTSDPQAPRGDVSELVEAAVLPAAGD